MGIMDTWRKEGQIAPSQTNIKVSIQTNKQTNKQPSYIISLETLISYLLSEVEDGKAMNLTTDEETHGDHGEKTDAKNLNPTYS